MFKFDQADVHENRLFSLEWPSVECLAAFCRQCSVDIIKISIGVQFRLFYFVASFILRQSRGGSVLVSDPRLSGSCFGSSFEEAEREVWFLFRILVCLVLVSDPHLRRLSSLEEVLVLASDTNNYFHFLV